MYRLVVETKKETEKTIEKQEEKAQEKQETKQEPEEEIQEETPSQTAYLKSFEGKTLADVKQESEEDFEQQKEELIQKQYEKEEQENIIEKPNYDLIEEKKSVIKIRQKLKQEPEKVARKKGKKFGLFLAIVLGICSIFCVTNIVILDNMSASYSALEHEYYNVNLPKYLKNISNLDTTKRSMEFLETYPSEMQSPADLGQKTNWFDKFCNFLSGIFGG